MNKYCYIVSQLYRWDVKKQLHCFYVTDMLNLKTFSWAFQLRNRIDNHRIESAQRNDDIVLWWLHCHLRKSREALGFVGLKFAPWALAIEQSLPPRLSTQKLSCVDPHLPQHSKHREGEWVVVLRFAAHSVCTTQPHHHQTKGPAFRQTAWG